MLRDLGGETITPPLMMGPANCAVPLLRTITTLSPYVLFLRERDRVLIARAPPTVKAHLPDHVTRPEEFAEIILGTSWVDDRETQHFCTKFLQKLRSFRIGRINAGLLSTEVAIFRPLYLGQKLATIKNNNINANSRPLSSAIFALSENFCSGKIGPAVFEIGLV